MPVGLGAAVRRAVTRPRRRVSLPAPRVPVQSLGHRPRGRREAATRLSGNYAVGRPRAARIRARCPRPAAGKRRRCRQCRCGRVPSPDSTGLASGRSKSPPRANTPSSPERWQMNSTMGSRCGAANDRDRVDSRGDVIDLLGEAVAADGIGHESGSNATTSSMSPLRPVTKS